MRKNVTFVFLSSTSFILYNNLECISYVPGLCLLQVTPSLHPVTVLGVIEKLTVR